MCRRGIARDASRQSRGGARDLSYDDVQTLLDPFYRTYWCADGRPFYVVAVSHRRHPRRLLEVLGIWDEAVAAGLPVHDPYLPTSSWPEGVDCTLLAHPISTVWAAWLSERIAAVLRSRSSHEWEEVFAAHGIPAVATRTTAEWLNADHAVASGLLAEDHHRELGQVRRMGPVLWTEDVPGATVERPTGSVDPSAGWLDGDLIVDLTNVIAGPTIGSTLARYGARVVKVDLPQPTFDPWNTVLCGLHSNRGKESVLLDAGLPAGREALSRLLARADVLTVNASEQQLARLGLTGADLAALAPRAVLCHLDAWGGPDGGPVAPAVRLRRSRAGRDRDHVPLRRGPGTPRRNTPTSAPSTCWRGSPRRRPPRSLSTPATPPDRAPIRPLVPWPPRVN